MIVLPFLWFSPLIFRIDHLLGRNTIENLTVLKFSNLVFMPLWNRNYIHNVQVTVFYNNLVQNCLTAAYHAMSFDWIKLAGHLVRWFWYAYPIKVVILPICFQFHISLSFISYPHRIISSPRYHDGNGVIADVVHSHILQTIALLAMEPPISLDGEDVRNEKVQTFHRLMKFLANKVHCFSIS